MTRAQWAAANGRPQPPYICLKGYTQNISGKSADSYCSGSVSGGNKSAARIIYDVAQACNISPKVLLVTLQKEQSLITDDWPWPVQYQKAMGYGCPDTSGCDPQFAGFFNQVWYAARQFQRYKIQSSLFNHRAGQTSRVYYNPSTSCGYTNITMYNHATAGLYNYTPYQPNSAALSNLYGTGNSCSAYGNRNFWRMYSDWFGNPLVDTSRDYVIQGDWDGDGEASLVIKRGNTFIFDDDNDGVEDSSYSWGRSDDKVMVGDWNGDGKDSIGLRRGNAFFFDYNNDAHADRYINSWGRPTDQLIVGNWAGSPDNNDGIGLKRDRTFYFDYDNDGSADLSMDFGKSSDYAFAGDWSTSAKDGIGLKRGNSFIFDYDLNSTSDESFFYYY